MTMPTEVIAALWGAGAGTASSVVIELGKTVLSRKRRARAIKVALYYEIYRHYIFEGRPSKDASPNFIIVGFERASYDAYLDEVPDLLPERLVGLLADYYANVTTAASQQQKIEDDTTKVREVSQDLIRLQSSQATSHPVDPDELRLLKDEAEQIAHRMKDMMEKNRVLMAVAMWQQDQLLAQLRGEFSHDPGQEPVDVLPKYREWFENVASRKVKKGS